LEISKYVSKNFHSVKPETPFKDITRIFFETGASVIPVTDETGTLQGIICIDDFMLIFLPDYIDLIKTVDFIHSFGALEKTSFAIEELLFVAEDLMKEDPPVLEEKDSFLKAIATLHKHNLSQIPVVRGDKLVGMISLNDICRGIYESKG